MNPHFFSFSVQMFNNSRCRNVKKLTLFVFAWLSVIQITAQEFKSPSEKLFAGDAPIEVTLKFDVKDLLRNKYTQEETWEAYISCSVDGEAYESELEIEPRGVFRRKFCYMPPLKLNFKKCENPEMDAWGKVKLVTHCKSGSAFEDYVLKEYLCYRMFNQLTDMSFRVRLGKFSYEDSRGKKKTETKWGFLIEQTKHLAKRNNAIELEEVVVNTEQTNREFMTLVSVFQYLLGNTDWSVPVLHNIKLLKVEDLKEIRPYAIPYDFDYSGMVNTPYAIPNEVLGIKTVRERLFRGYGRSEVEFQAVYDLFIEKKEALYKVVKDFEPLAEKHKKEMLRYMDEFYETIEDPRLANRRIAENARGIR